MKSILYIDDEPNILEAYALMLEHNGYTVFKAQDGNEGLKIMLSEEIDLVLSDINMPKKNGLTLIKQIRRILRYRNVPVVILSAVGTKHNVFKGVELGVDSFLTKPCDKERLLTTIENALCSENRIRSASVLKKRSSHSAGGTPGHAKILLSYNGAQVTDSINEYLSERYCNVYVEADTGKINELIHKKGIELLILEVNDSSNSYFKYLFDRYDQSEYIEIPTIVITEKKEDLALFFEGFDIKIDKIISKPFEYKQLTAAISQLLSEGCIKSKCSESIAILRSKLKDVKSKEATLKTMHRRIIYRLKKENYETINSEQIARFDKLRLVVENNKKINYHLTKITGISRQFLYEKRKIVNSISKIQTKQKNIHTFTNYFRTRVNQVV
ncbi:response regulator [candidate division KSB1 bacterium]